MTTPRIEEIFGPKCDTYEENCPTCEVYRAIEEAHQAGAVAVIDKLSTYLRHDIRCATEFEAGDCDCGLVQAITEYNQK